MLSMEVVLQELSVKLFLKLWRLSSVLSSFTQIACRNILLQFSQLFTWPS